MVSAIVDQSIKPKEKSSTSQLIWTTDYEVISPYTVEQCITQLNDLTTKYKNTTRSPFWNIIDFKFDSFHDNGGVVQYGMIADTGKLAIKGKAVIQLIYQSENNTLVRIHTSLIIWTLILFLVWLPFFNLIFLVPIHSSLWTFLVSIWEIYVLVREIRNCRALKPELYKTLCETLAVPQAPRPQILPP